METQIIFATFAAIFFVIPFFFWAIISFIDKHNNKIVTWHKPAKWLMLGICMIIFIIFLLLAIFV